MNHRRPPVRAQPREIRRFELAQQAVHLWQRQDLARSNGAVTGDRRGYPSFVKRECV
jgi:hypothetical protein